jgi:site-specific DNA recombinase
VRRKPQPEEPKRAIRCAVYTRKSTEEGLEQEFNSLDAQREAGELFVKSQQHEGWTCLPDRYDDGGFTGGNMDRPALKRLMADIEAGRVDCVVVYKVDRLSRSLLDFARIMETFERHKVSFVSVTQQFNTTHSMGRLTLNILLSFAQFEREIISERTRDKIAAARRKGKWSGGMPILGYDVLPTTKLAVNADEAVRVRAIFDLYLKERSLLPVVQVLNRRGWNNKRWQTRKGHPRGGKPFTRTSLHKLLTNVTYIGRVRYKHEDHPGEQPAIIDPETWVQVQALLRRNARNGGSEVRNRFGFTLKGLIHCAACGCAMTPSHSLQKKTKRYRYYVCLKATKHGWDACPSPSVPAGQVESFIAEQIREIGRDPDLRRETARQVREQERERLVRLDSELRQIDRDLAAWDADVRAVLLNPLPEHGGRQAALLAELHERMRAATCRKAEVQQEKAAALRPLDDREIDEALAVFDPVWNALTAKEQGRVLQLLVERVDYNGAEGKVEIAFHPAGIRSLLAETPPAKKRATR